MSYTAIILTEATASVLSERVLRIAPPFCTIFTLKKLQNKVETYIHDLPEALSISFSIYT